MASRKQPSNPQPKSALQEIIENNANRVTTETVENAMKSRYPEQLVIAFKDVMATEAGKRFLNELTNFYMQKPFDWPGAPDGQGKWRDGQASVLRDLWNIMNIK